MEEGEGTEDSSPVYAAVVECRGDMAGLGGDGGEGDGSDGGGVVDSHDRLGEVSDILR